MTETERDIGLSLLKRLWQRELISEAEYVAACSSRFFDAENFARDTGGQTTQPVQEGGAHVEG